MLEKPFCKFEITFAWFPKKTKNPPFFLSIEAAAKDINRNYELFWSILTLIMNRFFKEEKK